MPEPVGCTEISARWCPICGDCTCRHPEESMSDEDCPLHSPMSRHGEVEPVATIWGDFTV